MAKTKLTKAVIIEHLHDKLGANRNDIHEIVDAFFEEVKDSRKRRSSSSEALEHLKSEPARAERRQGIQRPVNSLQ